jgi:predicted GNAT family acetyltransferase
MIKAFSFNTAGEFLTHAQAALEADEAAHSLILGICTRLKNQPAQAPSRVCLKTIEDEGGLALAVMMDPPHNLTMSGQPADLDCSLGLLVSELSGEGWTIPGVQAPAPIARLFAEKWAKKSQGGFQLTGRLNLLELRQAPPALAPFSSGQARLRPASQDELALIARWCYAFTLEVFKTADEAEARQVAEQRTRDGDIFVWEDDGQVVSMAMKTRPTRRGISVSYVYTPPELRGKGYATACVAELSRQLLQSGWEFCTLFVDVANLPACRAYQKIGYSLVCAYEEYHFQPG